MEEDFLYKEAKEKSPFEVILSVFEETTYIRPFFLDTALRINFVVVLFFVGFLALNLQTDTHSGV